MKVRAKDRLRHRSTIRTWQMERLGCLRSEGLTDQRIEALFRDVLEAACQLVTDGEGINIATLDMMLQARLSAFRPDSATPTGAETQPAGSADCSARTQSRLDRTNDKFTRHFQSHYDSAVRIAMSIIGRRDLAADAVQEAAINAFKHQHQRQGKFGPWFRTIVRNAAIRVRRDEARRKRHVEFDVALVAERTGQAGGGTEQGSHISKS